MATTARSTTPDWPAPVDAPATGTDPSGIGRPDEREEMQPAHLPMPVKLALAAVGVGATVFVFARRRARRQQTRLDRLAATGNAAVERARETIEQVRPKVEAMRPKVEAVRPKVEHLVERAHELLPTG